MEFVHEEIEMWSGGYPFPSEKLDVTLPRILCQRCYEALHSSKKIRLQVLCVKKKTI